MKRRLIMKNLSKVVALAGVTAIATTVSLSPVMAGSPGQLAGGAVYKVKDVTQNGSYSNSINANACDELEYSITLHNTEFGKLSNIMVNATLPSNGTSTMTATPDAGGTTGTSGTVNVNLGSAQGVAYENGTTQLFDGSGHLVKTLPDGIAGNGINVGDLNGSTGEFVNFKAKVNCPTPVTPSVTPPATPGAPAALPQTGADELAALAGVGGTGAIGYGVMAYRRSKKALADKLLNRK